MKIKNRTALHILLHTDVKKSCFRALHFYLGSQNRYAELISFKHVNERYVCRDRQHFF